MNLRQRIASWILGKSQLTNKDDWFYEWALGGSRSSTGIVISPRKALQDIIVMACVTIRAQDLAKLPVHVYRETKGGQRDIIKEHPLERILRKPNPWQTRFEFLEQLGVHYLLKGNAYAVLPRDGRGRATMAAPIESMEPYTSGLDLFYRPMTTNEHEREIVKAFNDLIPAGDVLHLRWASLDGISGLSRVGLAREAIGLDLAMEKGQANVFAKGAQVPGILSTEHKLGDESFKRLKSQWAKYEGTAGERSGGTPLLEEGLKYEKIAMTMVEAQTVEARRAQFEQIATAFDVPLHRLGIMPEGGATAVLQAHQMYLNNTLSSDAERWEAKLNDAFGLDGESEYVEFDLEYFNRADTKTRLEAVRIGVVGVVYTINEARAKLGLPPVPDGDTLLQPTNVAPFPYEPPEPSTGVGSDQSGEPAAGGDGDPAAVPDDGAKRLNGMGH